MRKPSREQLEADSKRLSAENTLMMQAMQFAVAGKIHWYAAKKDKEGEGRYKFGLAYAKYRTFLFLTFIKAGQQDHTAVYDLDEYLSGPFRLDRDAFTHWYKFACEEIYKAERLAREHEELEKAKGVVPA